MTESIWYPKSTARKIDLIRNPRVRLFASLFSGTCVSVMTFLFYLTIRSMGEIEIGIGPLFVLSAASSLLLAIPIGLGLLLRRWDSFYGRKFFLILVAGWFLAITVAEGLVRSDDMQFRREAKAQEPHLAMGESYRRPRRYHTGFQITLIYTKGTGFSTED